MPLLLVRIAPFSCRGDSDKKKGERDALTSLNIIMCAIRSVKIIHDIIHRADYIFLSEFLRYIGVLVYEDILFDREIDKTSYEKKTQCSACVFIGERSLSEENRDLLAPIVDETEYADLISRLPEDTLFLYEECEKAEAGLIIKGDFFTQKTCLQAIIGKILYLISQKVERDQYCFEDDLIPIFVQNNLFLHSVTMQYYSKTNDNVIQEAKDAFVAACKDLEKCNTKNYTGKMRAHYMYALLWTKVKGNIACDYLEHVLYFPEDRMFEDCRKLIEDYPDFSNAKVLMGLCYEPLKKRTRDTVNAFSNALDDIEDECFAASVYYWIGKRFETDGRYPEQAKECYRRSNNRSVKFRSLFKLGIISRKEKNYGEAISFFDTILTKLQAKDTIGYTDPLELEYIQKAYLQKCITYYEGRRYDKVRENMKLAEEAQDKIKQNKFFGILYADKQETYQGLSGSRVNISQFKSLMKEAFPENTI